MEEDKFKEMFIKYAQELLSVDVERYGMYGEQYVEVSLKIDGEIINTVTFPLSTN